MDATGPIARRFPLIARHRPACAPLTVRVAGLRSLADDAARTGDLATASTVHNQAALLASDLGLPDLARHWCHRHAAAYLRACPLPAHDARRALEPLVNLARLHLRAGNGDHALDLLTTLNQAVTTRADTTVDGLLVPATTLTATDNDHQELRRWLWTVLLADGTRALTSAGRWHDAHTHLQRHNGIGQRMLDGRQVAVIAHLVAGEPHHALTLLARTAPGEPWENAVTSCLTVLARDHANQPPEPDRTTMFSRYHQLDPTTHPTVFHTRLSLTIIDAAGGVNAHPTARRTAAALIDRTTSSRDGYAARDVLAHDDCNAMLSPDQQQHLTDTLTASGLGCNEIPAVLTSELSAALATSEEVLSTVLHSPATAPR